MDDAADLAARVRRGPRPAPSRCSARRPAPLGKLRGEYRAQIFLKGTQAHVDARGADQARRRDARPCSGA